MTENCPILDRYFSQSTCGLTSACIFSGISVDVFILPVYAILTSSIEYVCQILGKYPIRIGQYHGSLKTAPKIEVCIHLVTAKKVRKNTGKRMRIGLLGLLVLDSLMVNVSKQRFP